MDRIKSLALKDLLHASRENILVYSLLFPLVFALLYRVFLPSLESVEMTFAVDGSVPAQVVARLNEYGAVERFENPGEVRERVGRFDDVPGIYLDGDDYVVLLEGNEEEYVRQLAGAVLDYINGGREVESTSVSLRREASLAREYGAILLALTCMSMGGLAIGLSIVDDRESRTLRALAVTPLKTGGYLVGKSAFGLSTSFALALASMAIILGPGPDYLKLAAAVTTALAWGLATGFLMGYVCPNQLAAIALLKVMALVLLGIPFAAMFVPSGYRWTMYAFPNYWSFEAMRRTLIEPDVPTIAPNLMALFLGALAVAAALPPVRRRFRM